MSETTRVGIDYAAGATGPASVVLKTASADEGSRATGVGLGIYEREVRFYRELAPRIGGPLADCHFAAITGDGSFTIVLEDLAPATQGDQIAGCTIEQARLAMRSLARLHAPVFADPQLGATPWLNQGTVLTQALVAQLLDGFIERHGERVERRAPRGLPALRGEPRRLDPGAAPAARAGARRLPPRQHALRRGRARHGRSRWWTGRPSGGARR